MSQLQESQQEDLTESHQKSRVGSWTVSAIGALLMLAGAHFLVDLVATLVSPLWPELEERLFGTSGSILWVFVLYSATTSFSQFLFAYWGDCFQSRWLLWAGPALAIVCLSCIGLVHSPWMLAGLLILGGLGIAAFHPEAVAAAGQQFPNDRSRATSIFAMGGYLGQAAGPYYSGRVTDLWGMSALSWGIVWGLAAVLIMRLTLLGARSPMTPQSKAERVSLADVFRGRGWAAGLVLSIGTLRVISAMGVPLALAFLLKSRGSSNTEIGLAQSTFMAGIGSGALACALLVHRHLERPVLWWMPIFAAPLILLIPTASGWSLLLATTGTGILLGVTLPVLISFGQQLFTRGRRIGSSLSMGVSWGTGGALVAAILELFGSVGHLEAAFWVFASTSVISSFLSLRLPRIEQESFV